MRACTIAGINVSLLLRERICGGFADGHLPVGICRWCCMGRGFFLAFVGYGSAV